MVYITCYIHAFAIVIIFESESDFGSGPNCFRLRLHRKKLDDTLYLGGQGSEEGCTRVGPA